MKEAVTTILIPLKNYHPAYLRECMRSVVDQTSPHWLALIIVEPQDLESFTRMLGGYLDDPRVRIIPNEGRKLAGALNTGMKRATTPFLGILLSDDAWSPNAIQILSEHQQRFPQIDFFHSSRVIIDESGHAISRVYRSRKHFEWRDFLDGSPVKHLLCWRREKALSFGGMDESLDSVGPDDFDFPWLMLEHGATFMGIDECLYFYRDHRQSFRLTTHLPKSVHKQQLERILRKHSVPESDIRRTVSQARRSYFRQCFYRSEFERKLRNWLGWEPRKWRQHYEI